MLGVFCPTPLLFFPDQRYRFLFLAFDWQLLLGSEQSLITPTNFVGFVLFQVMSSSLYVWDDRFLSFWLSG